MDATEGGTGRRLELLDLVPLAHVRRNGENIVGGTYQGIRLSYMSTDRDMGAITEIFDFPEGHTPTPDSVYPPAPG